MSDSYINQITIDCLLNREVMGEHIMKQREKQINKDELNFYRKRIYNLFKMIISNQSPLDMPPDVRYAYDTFIKASIHYFKVADNNDLLQEEYKDVRFSLNECSEQADDMSINIIANNEANKFLMRSVKMDMPTLDKYVKRTSVKKPDAIILPKSREVDITNPELKNKGLKKNNINNLYEDNNSKQENQEQNKKK
jgi:hypothetical protein